MSASKDVLEDRTYTKEHEWALATGEAIVVGITAFAVDQLGDITLVSLDVHPGDEVQQNQVFGTIESVKTLSDLFSPVSGRVVRVNADLENAPELVNEDCWTKGWMVAIQPSRLEEERSSLLDAAGYRALLESADS
jgi:glycine cleavage system H protein